MILQNKVGHTVLKRGDIVKSPSGSSDWVVIDHDEDKVVLASISKYMHKEEGELRDWYKIR